MSSRAAASMTCPDYGPHTWFSIWRACKASAFVGSLAGSALTLVVIFFRRKSMRQLSSGKPRRLYRAKNGRDIKESGDPDEKSWRDSI